MDKPFVAVVTGASSGIGQSIAMEFARRNACLVLHCRKNLCGMNTTVANVQSVYKQTVAPKLCSESLLTSVSDIQDPTSSRSLVEAAFERHGYVDVWVHAAGADVLTGDARRLSFSEKLSRLWATDVHGTMVLSRMVAAKMLAQSGPADRLPSIIHIGWDQAQEGMEGDSGQFFSATKAAVAAFSKSLAKSLAPFVRVNCIAPGWVQTDWGLQSSDGWQQRAVGESMLHRWGKPEDIARVVVSLSLSDGAFINGQTIAVNGGWQSMSLSAISETNLDE